jgi:hypothetical protein
MPNRIMDDGALLAWLSDLAETGQPCPSNAEINRRFAVGNTMSGCAAAAIKRLLQTKQIAIQSVGRQRQVIIGATGKATAVGARASAVIPESDTREAVVAAIIDLAREGKTEAFIMKAMKLPRRIVRYVLKQAREQLAEDRVTRVSDSSEGHGQHREVLGAGGVNRLCSPQLGFIGPSSSCRWIEEPDRRLMLARAFAGDPTLYCGRRSVPGRSWCPEHQARVVKRRTAEVG